MRVKICGVTSLADATMAVKAGAGAIGFNFYPPSPRCVAPESAAAMARELPLAVWRVGVFVDQPRDVVERVIATAGLTVLQFHGDESAAYCCSWPLPVIKAVRVRSRADVQRAVAYPVDFVLLDAYVEGAAGGTGKSFDWTLLGECARSRLILAGGLTAANVADAVRRVRPYGVDVASGVECRPGVKDPEKVRRFIASAQNA